ncbi:Arginine deiminase [Streptomyces sp. RB17]|nr:Arginine deiminase [Streptomyces sp. RB17]
MWVENAQRDHADFVNKLRSRGIDVVELHDGLAQTVAIPEARDWLLDRKIVPNQMGLGLVEGTRAYLETLPPRQVAEFLIGDLATSDLPEGFRSGYLALVREATGAREYLMPPLPNTLYTRDTTCWLYIVRPASPAGPSRRPAARRRRSGPPSAAGTTEQRHGWSSPPR